MSDEEHGEFPRQLRKKAERRERKRAERRAGVWFAMGTFGIVGWSIAIPTLLFLALGIWLDEHFEAKMSWTLAMLLAGVTLGCFNAWYWVTQYTPGDDDERSD